VRRFLDEPFRTRRWDETPRASCQARIDLRLTQGPDALVYVAPVKCKRRLYVAQKLLKAVWAEQRFQLTPVPFSGGGLRSKLWCRRSPCCYEDLS